MKTLQLLSRLSEAGEDAILTGGDAERFPGRELDRMLGRRVLIQRPRLTAWEVCDDCDCGADHRPLVEAAGGYRAACPVNAGADVMIDEADLVSWIIDADALAAEISRAAGLDDGAERVGAGLWKLGVGPSGAVVLLAFTEAGACAESLPTKARQLANGRRVLLIAPRLPAAELLRLRDAGLAVCEISDLFGRGTIAASLAAIDSAGSAAPDEARLVFRAASGELRFSGHIVVLQPTVARVFALLAAGVVNEAPFVSSDDIIAATGRQQRDVIRDLRDAMKGGGISAGDVKSLIKNIPRRGWRLALAAHEVALED